MTAKEAGRSECERARRRWSAHSERELVNEDKRDKDGDRGEYDGEREKEREREREREGEVE